MSTVGDLFLKHQFHQFFGGRGHILEALSERNHREAHTLKVLHHLDSAPTVKGNLTDVVAFTQAFDEFFDVTIVNDIAVPKHHTAHGRAGHAGRGYLRVSRNTVG